MVLKFQPWRPVHAEYNRAAVIEWLNDVAQTAHRVMRAGSEASRGGRIYRRRGGAIHRASAPGAWPARMTGRLLGSIRTRVTQLEAEIGTSARSDKGAPYSLFLRRGTRKMARRKMSDHALREAIPIANARKKSFARFRSG